MTCEVCKKESEQVICEECQNSIRVLRALAPWKIETMLLLGNISVDNANAYRWAWRNSQNRAADLYKSYESASMEAIAILHTLE